jgi:hypothetical protein
VHGAFFSRCKIFSSFFLSRARGYYIGGKITCKIAFSLYAAATRARQKAKWEWFSLAVDWIMVKRIYCKADG